MDGSDVTSNDCVKVLRRSGLRDASPQFQGDTALHQKQRVAVIVGQRREELGDDQNPDMLLEPTKDDSLALGSGRQAISQCPQIRRGCVITQRHARLPLFVLRASMRVRNARASSRRSSPWASA